MIETHRRLSSEVELFHQKRVIEYYHATTPFYRRIWSKRGLGFHYGLWFPGVTNREDAIIKENEYLANLAYIQKNQLVLDAGCGLGGSGIWLEKNRGARVIGVNIVDTQLRKAKKISTASKLEQQYYLMANYHDLSLQSEIIDTFWSLESIEHASDVALLMRNAYRVLKPGGMAVIAGMFMGEREPTPAERMKIELGVKISGTRNDLLSADQVMKYMIQTGFEEKLKQDLTSFVKQSSRQMSRMCRLGLPAAHITARLGIISPILIDNNRWGIYQEDLLNSGAVTYNVLLAQKPMTK